VYCVWQEQNARIFAGMSKLEFGLWSNRKDDLQQARSDEKHSDNWWKH
jgi:hypothetical protein